MTMVVKGEALSIFTIDSLPMDKSFQVILKSKLMVIGTDGVEYGHSDLYVTSTPFRCLGPSDSELVIQDWLPYSKGKLVLVKPDLECQNNLTITFSIKNLINEAKIEGITADCCGADIAYDSGETESTHAETGTDVHKEQTVRRASDRLSGKLDETVKQNQDSTNQRVSRKRRKTKAEKAEEPKTRKRQKDRAIDKQTSKVKLKRRKAENKIESELVIQKVKTEQDDSCYIKTFKDIHTDSKILHDSLEIKVDSSLNEYKAECNDGNTNNNRKSVQRQRNGKLKSSKLTTKSAKRRKSQIEGVNTEGIDPKLVYAKKSLEKQNTKNAKRKRVELKDHCDKYRTTVVESLAQKDRGKSLKEKSYQSYECTVCGRFQSTIPEKIRFHIEQHVNGELECKKCGYILSYAKEISRHNKEVHKSDFVNKRVCELCGETAGSFRMWKAHMSKIHKVPSFKCAHCSEKFFNAAEVVTHTREAHKDIILTCGKCGQIFVSRSNWSYHSVRCNGTTTADSFVCDQCGKNLGSSIMLKRHVRHNHEMEKTQKCSFCSYATHTVARLQKHINAHLGNKQYHCENCQFSCVQKYQLTSHMRTHNGVKPYRCDQCPYAVAWNVQLKTHKKVHSLATAMTCTHCGVVFRDAKTLGKHEQKDHVEKTSSDNGNTKDSNHGNIVGYFPVVSSSLNIPVVSSGLNIPGVSSELNSCINDHFSTITSAEEGPFMNVHDARNVIYGMNGTVPSLNNNGMMNVNRNMRNHLGQQDNNPVPLSTEVPLFPFSFQ